MQRPLEGLMDCTTRLEKALQDLKAEFQTLLPRSAAIEPSFCAMFRCVEMHLGRHETVALGRCGRGDALPLGPGRTTSQGPSQGPLRQQHPPTVLCLLPI